MLLAGRLLYVFRSELRFVPYTCLSVARKLSSNLFDLIPMEDEISVGAFLIGTRE